MKSVLIATAVCLAALPALAERYVVITHTQGKDPFWPVVEKGARDAGAAVGAEIEYRFDPDGDLAGMSRLIDEAAASQPDGIITSLPDADALGGAIRAAVAAGIPVVTMNSGLVSSRAVGALMHIGQHERNAGHAAGQRAKAEGVTRGLCLNQEIYNTALIDRCTGYSDAMGAELNQIEVTNDPEEIKSRTVAALEADPEIDGLLAVAPHVCEAAQDAIEAVGSDIHLACFDLSPRVVDLIKQGKVAFTIDQQQYLQGYMPVIVLHLYNSYAGMLPATDIPSGPGFVDASNAESVEAEAGVNR
ncbi:MAG: sugar ABC transporter substrate-binding protein [Rhodobacteraceae bacterium]|nr:MAG: sugar ABC transporter substrate-binding protein [Paracoccaceae bacterium]